MSGGCYNHIHWSKSRHLLVFMIMFGHDSLFNFCELLLRVLQSLQKTYKGAYEICTNYLFSSISGSFNPLSSVTSQLQLQSLLCQTLIDFQSEQLSTVPFGVDSNTRIIKLNIKV